MQDTARGTREKQALMFQLYISQLNGNCLVLDGVFLDDQLDTIRERVALKAGVHKDAVVLAHGTEVLKENTATIRKLGLHEGSSDLTLLISEEYCNLDTKTLRHAAPAYFNNPDTQLEERLKKSYVYHYDGRRSRFSSESYEEQPVSPEEFPPSICNRLTVESALQAAQDRQSRLNLLTNQSGHHILHSITGQQHVKLDLRKRPFCFEEEGREPVVVDVGSCWFKAGWAGNDSPAVIFPSVVPSRNPHAHRSLSTLTDSNLHQDSEEHDFDARAEAKYVLEHGIVLDWEGMEQMWHRLFYNELKIDPRDHPLFLTEPVLNPKRNRNKMIALLCSHFSIWCLYVEAQPVVSLWKSGRVSGAVVDIGDGVAQVVCIWGAYLIVHSAARMSLAGRDITEYLLKSLRDRHVFLETQQELALVCRLKEENCYVAIDFDNELATDPREHEVEVNVFSKNFSLASERFKCPEILFQPHLADVKSPGVHHLVHSSISSCGMDIHRDLYSNIILGGGSTLFPGFPERLQLELGRLAPRLGVRIDAAEDRQCMAWLGASSEASRSFLWMNHVRSWSGYPINEDEDVEAFDDSSTCQSWLQYL